MTDAEVIAAIQKCHLKANIQHVPSSRQRWSQAWLDLGGTIFGPGPYVKLPVGSGDARVVIRVYPPARLRRQLAKRLERV